MVTPVGIGYEAGSGKDTVAGILEHSYKFEVVPLAAALKHASVELFGLEADQVWGPEKDAVDPYWGVTPRNILQRLMAAVRDEFGPDVAMRSWCRDVEKYMEQGGRVVAPDVRRINEAEAIKKMGGLMIKVVRPNRMLLSERDATHVTEHELADWNGWDAIIVNDGTISDLCRKTTETMTMLGVFHG